MLPTLFVAHGSPLLLEDAEWVGQLRGWGEALPRPEALLVISAHWETPGQLTLSSQGPLIHDFYGFPERFYQLDWPAPGAPELLRRLRGLLPEAKVEARGLDHGAWVPLKAMWPSAELPTMQLSLPTLDPASLLALGRRLRPLREEGVLVVASGFLTHNMREIAWGGGPTPRWAMDFDRWIASALREGDLGGLTDWRIRAPNALRAHPRSEHLAPLFVALGAAEGEPLRFPIEGWKLGSFTKRSVQFG